MDVGQNDLVKCRLDVFNSVDMSWAFQVFSGAYRTLCQNTQVFGGEKAYQQKHLHSKNLDVDALLNNAQTSLSSWNKNKDTILCNFRKLFTITKHEFQNSDLLQICLSINER